MRVSAAGNMPLQGLVKPPAKPVVMIMAKNSSNIEKKRGIDRFFWYAFVTF